MNFKFCIASKFCLNMQLFFVKAYSFYKNCKMDCVAINVWVCPTVASDCHRTYRNTITLVQIEKAVISKHISLVFSVEEQTENAF